MQLRIDLPCQENWADMTTQGPGRFCGHCQQTVIDFTGMTDAAILSVLAAKGKCCGRFTASQLNRHLQEPVALPVETPVQRKSWRNAWPLAALLTLSVPAAAMAIPRAPMVQQSIFPQVPGDTVSPLHGRVVDIRGQRIAGVAVLLKGTDIKTLTDSTGSFTFRQPVTLGAHAKLVFNALGYEQLEVKVHNGKAPEKVVLQELVMGAIAIVYRDED